MPHAAAELADGVNVNRTPALNQFGLSASNLIRYQYDDTGKPLVQKLGGWQKYLPTQPWAPARALWGWMDTDSVTHLAIGTQTGGGGHAQLAVATAGTVNDITPTTTSDNVTPAASATMGSAVVTITDATTTGITSYDSVYIMTHISVGGIVLFGLYPTTGVTNTTYSVVSEDILGALLPATSTSTSTTVALFSTTNGSNVVKVTLNNHGYQVGSTYPVLISTTVGGVTLFGNYIVQSVIDANNFNIFTQQNATSTTTGSINGGNAAYLYSFGLGAIAPGGGYGSGGYGRGGYGTGSGVTPATGTPIAASDWTLDNFGEVLVACPITGTLFQPIYAWDPLSGQPIAGVISTGPPLNDGIFVAMPQRQLVAWGSTETGIQDPLLIRWSDVNNFNQWIDTVLNQAGSFRIPRGSKIVGCIQGPQQSLVWTDVGLWAMSYIGGGGFGAALVYAFNEIGTGCGLIARKAAASANGVIYWMGPTQFFVLNANGVEALSCPIWDVAFQDLDTSNLSKIRVAVNSRFNEVAWYIPTLSSGGEVALYVKYNYAIGFWDYGALARSAWIDQSALGAPIGADPNLNYIYQHEISNDADGVAMTPSYQTGYFAIAEGDQQVFVDEVWPDFKYGDFSAPPTATLKISFSVVNYPGQTPVVLGPYTVTDATTWFNTRFRGRLISMTVSGNDVGTFWRNGRTRFRYAPDGRYG
jgi:hypothetical protein